MRDNLQAMGAEQRHTFTATFERTGYKTKDVRYATYYQPTLLVNDVTDEQGKVLTDHLWFNYTLGFQKLGHLEKGDRLQFDGRITTYTKGYQGWDAELSAEHPIETDYKIERPTKIKLLGVGEERPPLPKDNWDLVQQIMADNAAFYQARDAQAATERAAREAVRLEKAKREFQKEKRREEAERAAEEAAAQAEGRTYRFALFSVTVLPQPHVNDYGDLVRPRDRTPREYSRYRIVDRIDGRVLDDNHGDGYLNGPRALRAYQKQLRQDQETRLTQAWLAKQPSDLLWDWVQVAQASEPMLTAGQLRVQMKQRVAKAIGNPLTEQASDISFDAFFRNWWRQIRDALGQIISKRRHEFLAAQPPELPTAWFQEAVAAGVQRDDRQQYVLTKMTEYISGLSLEQQVPPTDGLLRRWQKLARRATRQGRRRN